MLKLLHGIIKLAIVYIAGGQQLDDLKGIRSFLYRCVKCVDVVRKLKKDSKDESPKELIMGILDNVIPGLGMISQVLELVPKGNRRKAGKALAEQLEIQLKSLAGVVQQAADATTDPMQKFALLQHASQLAGMAVLADKIGDILVGEDEQSPN